MNREERLLTVIRAPHISEKALMLQKTTTLLFSKLQLMQAKTKLKLLSSLCLKLKSKSFVL